jgi:acyl-CoA thioesterase-1
LLGVSSMGKVGIRLSVASNLTAGLLLVAVALYEDVPSRVAARLFSPPILETAHRMAPPSQLTKFAERLQGNDSVIIVAFGDSVTQGATSIRARDPESVYHNQLKRLLENRHPDVTFSVINSGTGGDEAPDGLARIDRSVIRFSPDLVLIQFGLNDCVNRGLAGMRDFKLAIAGIVGRIQQQTEAEIVLLTPNFIATSDNRNVHEEHRQKGYAETFSRIQNRGVLARYAQALREVAVECDIPVADVYSRWERMSDAVDTNILLANGLNHPDAEGHRITTEAVMALIDPEFVGDSQRVLAIVKEQ